MDSPKEKAFFAVLLLEATIGVLSSLFMIICLFVKKFYKTNMKTYSKILIPLNMSNLCYCIILFLNINIGFLWPEVYAKTSMYYTIMYVTLYSITSYLWLATVLCVFYFLKIVSSQPGVLTTMKRIDDIIWWLIVTSEVVALGGGFLSLLLSPSQINQGNSSITMSDMASPTSTQKAFMGYILILNSLPFSVIMVTTIGSAGFLRVYNHQIQKNMAASGETRMRDYRVAIHTMIGLLALYVTILLCNILLLLDVFSYKHLGYDFCVIFLFSCASSLPALLIYGNPTLRETIRQMFTH
ncbi:taste receptor type 2 member 13-like [Dendropsophus ebraccatus]|uniref:taste receptor type 2 member 13-like n=1 Tax=Dendropsophus ebraccatus TaxID=150705 RepID=UPI003831D36A